MVALCAVLFSKRLVKKILGFGSALLRKKLPVEKKLKSFYEGFGKTKHANLPVIVFLTVVEWLLDICILWIAAFSLGINLPFIFCMGVYAISTLGGVVSSLPGGLGSLEIILFGFFLTYGISEPLSLSIALLYRFISLGGGLVFCSIFLFREVKK
jgi:uncharacterized protein (TIRG00374 family)